MRGLDFVLSLIGFTLCLPLLAMLCLIGWLEWGAPLFAQERIGKDKKRFVILKLRTMPIGTAAVGTHLVSRESVGRWGRILRELKLDELPQLWCVLVGDMSLVGPRPCLPNQAEVIRAREEQGVFAVKPGITGLAQLRGVDMSAPDLLAETDAEMIRDFGVLDYWRLVLATMLGRGTGDQLKS